MSRLDQPRLAPVSSHEPREGADARPDRDDDAGRYRQQQKGDRADRGHGGRQKGRNRSSQSAHEQHEAAPDRRDARA